MLRGQVSHTGNEKQKSQIWMEFGMKDRAEPQSIPPGAQLKSLCDWHKALVNAWVSVMLTLLLQMTFMS